MATLEALRIDRRGLGPTHRQALTFLRRHDGIGEGRLAGLLGIPIRTFRRIYKVHLLRLGLVTVTPRGLALVPSAASTIGAAAG